MTTTTIIVADPYLSFSIGQPGFDELKALHTGAIIWLRSNEQHANVWEEVGALGGTITTYETCTATIQGQTVHYSLITVDTLGERNGKY